MSDTPRMNAAQMAAMEHGTGNVYRVGCDIERELNEAQQRIKRLETGDAALNYSIGLDLQKEEALEGTVKWIVELANRGNAVSWNTEEQSVIIAARAALKKEANL
jgi:hypothetical protein